MRYLKENTATRVTVGPFLDVTDGITPEIALTVTGCLLTFVVDDAGVPTLVIDAAPTASAGSNDMVHITSDAAGYYDLELTAAQTNYTGRAILNIIDTDVHLPVFHEFQIVSANVYDSLFTDGDVLDTSMTQIDGSATAAANLSASALGIITGSTSGSPSQTSTNTNLSGYADDELINRVIVFTGGDANGIAATITDYANTSGVVTYATIATAPAASDTFVIV